MARAGRRRRRRRKLETSLRSQLRVVQALTEYRDNSLDNLHQIVARNFKKHQGIQRAYSDSLQVTDPIIKELDESLGAYQAEIVVCECCGMSEDCTPTYISRIKENFCGKWVCGLCSEAVKEQLKRIPPLAMDEALESHMSLCKKFNRTVRLNPKLSLAGAMRDIAKKSSEHRTSYHSCASKIVRTFSCNCA